MGRFLLIFALFLLVAGGGTAAWWFGLRGEPMPFAGGDAPETPEAEAAAPASRFVDLKPITFPVVRDGQVRELRTLVVSIEVLNDSAHAAVIGKRRHLRDAMLRELHALYGYRFMRDHDQPLQLVKRRLARVGRSIVGEGLRGVYVQAVQGRGQAQQAERTGGQVR